MCNQLPRDMKVRHAIATIVLKFSDKLMNERDVIRDSFTAADSKALQSLNHEITDALWAANRLKG